MPNTCHFPTDFEPIVLIHNYENDRIIPVRTRNTVLPVRIDTSYYRETIIQYIGQSSPEDGISYGCTRTRKPTCASYTSISYTRPRAVLWLCVCSQCLHSGVSEKCPNRMPVVDTNSAIARTTKASCSTKSVRMCVPNFNTFGYLSLELYRLRTHRSRYLVRACKTEQWSALKTSFVETYHTIQQASIRRIRPEYHDPGSWILVHDNFVMNSCWQPLTSTVFKPLPPFVCCNTRSSPNAWTVSYNRFLRKIFSILK